MPYQTGDNLFAISKYIVSPSGTPYTTIQAAINDAQAAGGGIVYIRPGTYTENLVLYDSVFLEGSANLSVSIVGIHTPPVAGTCQITSVDLTSATHAFSSAAAGSTTLTVRDCRFHLTNGYAFDVVNWTGTINIFNCADISADNHGINNTGNATVLIKDSFFGYSTTTSLINGLCNIFYSHIYCPITKSGTLAINIDSGSVLYRTLTVSDSVTTSINNSSLFSGADPAIVTTSSSAVTLSNVVIDSSANPNIDGTGTVVFGEVTFLKPLFIPVTITQSYNSGVQTGIIDLPNTDNTENGTLRMNGDPFLSNFGTNNTFVGIDSGSLGLTTAAGNCTFGAQCCNNLDTGQNNSCYGFGSGTSIETGSDNCLYGYSTGSGIIAGGLNCGFGDGALDGGDGSNNIALGYQAASAYAAAESDNIIIGNPGTIGDNHKMRLGTTGNGAFEVNATYIAAIYNTTPAGATYPVVIDSNGQLGSSTTTHVINWTTAIANVNPVAANTGYVIKHATPANKVTLTLDATYAVGDTIVITGYTAGGWRLAQLANQQIFFGASSTTIGVGGYLEFTNAHDSITLVCVTANLEFNVISSIGNLTVV
jgi:hypothetical protein